MNTDDFLTDAEKFANRKFRFRNEIVLLMDAAGPVPGDPRFDEIVFLAKFITNASNVLRRVGHPREETAKLSAEFSEKLERISSLIRELIAGLPGEKKAPFESRFLQLSHGGMQDFMLLLSELAWIKNYLLDRPPPA